MKQQHQFLSCYFLITILFFSGCATTAYISSVNDLELDSVTYEGKSVHIKSISENLSIQQKETKQLIEDTMSRMGYEIKELNDADYLLVFGSEEKTSKMSGSRPVTNTAITNVYSGNKSALATTTTTSYVPYSYNYTVAKLYTYLLPTNNLKPLKETEIIWQGYIGAEADVMKSYQATLIDQLFDKMGQDYAEHTPVRRDRITSFSQTLQDSKYTILSQKSREENEGVFAYSPELTADWHKSAEQGSAIAQQRMGLLYSTGQGVMKDDVIAYMWCNLAAAQGNEEARAIKIRLTNRMTKEQIAEAQKLSREWLAKRAETE